MAVGMTKHAFDVVNDYLYAVGQIDLERVLCEGCVSGRVPLIVAEYANIRPELTHRVVEDDGGVSETYQGMLTIVGVTYRFICHLFIDTDACYFVSDVGVFEP